jgi:hypothetical protein
MVLMSKILTDERAVNDLLAYIRTLNGQSAVHALPPSRTAMASSESIRRGNQ